MTSTSRPKKFDTNISFAEIDALSAKKKVLIVAGEASGDQYGAELINEVRALSPDTIFFGVGGKKMRDAGLYALVNSEVVTVVGLVEVLKHIKPIKNALDSLKESMKVLRPDLIILIDFPDFNFRVAKAAINLKGSKIPILYYISPQVWAWRRGRIKTISNFVDKMVVIFPFEEDIYKEAGVNVEFLGHPLMDLISGAEEAPDKKVVKVDAAKGEGVGPSVALLPGSRKSEIERHLPHLLGAGEIIKKKYPNATFTIPLALTLEMEDLTPWLESSSLKVDVVKDAFHHVVREADIAIVTSGTATIETALMGTPMVVVYRLNSLTYLIARILVRVDYIAMVNLVAGKKVVPELIQSEVNAENIANHVLSILSDDAATKKMKDDLSEVKRRIGKPGASARVAKSVVRFL